MVTGASWSFGWTALAAIGALALAAVVFVTAVVTSRGLARTRRSLSPVADALRASLLPVLEPVPPHTGKHKRSSADRIDYTGLGGPADERWAWPYVVDILPLESGIFCSVPVRNIGPGVARLSTEVATRALSVPDDWWSTGEPTGGLVAPRARTRMQFRLPGVRDELYVEVDYSDLGGEQRRRLRLYLRRGDAAYEVRGAATYVLTPAGATLFAVAGDERVTTPGA